MPDRAIAATHNKLVLPEYDEGFDELYYVHMENGDFHVQTWKENKMGLPPWQKRGIGVYFQDVTKEGYNPVKDEKVVTQRRDLAAMMGFSFVPMRSLFNSTVEKIAKVIYSEQISRMLSQINSLQLMR